MSFLLFLVVLPSFVTSMIPTAESGVDAARRHAGCRPLATCTRVGCRNKFCDSDWTPAVKHIHNKRSNCKKERQERWVQSVPVGALCGNRKMRKPAAHTRGMAVEVARKVSYAYCIHVHASLELQLEGNAAVMRIGFGEELNMRAANT